MKEVARSNNPILLSWLESVLADAGINTVMFDTHTALVEGSIVAIEKRLMVDDSVYAKAKSIVDDAKDSFANEHDEH